MNKINMKKIEKNEYSAFSFVEVMVAIFIITVGFLAGVALISKALKDSMDSRNQVTAGLLAQEGIENVRNARDNACFNGIKDGGLASLSELNKNMAHLYIKDGRYSESEGDEPTKFYRKVIVGDIESHYLEDNRLAYQSRSITSFIFWGSENERNTVGDSISKCKTGNKCAYAKTELSEWCEQSITQN